jgi:hypothetical protein
MCTSFAIQSTQSFVDMNFDNNGKIKIIQKTKISL